MPWRGERVTAWRTSPLPRNWPATQPRILRRDSYTCQIRGPRCTTVATEVDHTGDPDDHRDEMLQAVCSTCHKTKTGRDAGVLLWLILGVALGIVLML